MPKDMSYYQNMAQLAIEADAQRDIDFQKYDDMWHLEYDLPTEVEQLGWVRKVIASDPHDAVSAGTRVLSSTVPAINFQPTVATEASIKHANRVEKVLEWMLKQADRRRKARVIADIARHALLHSAVAVQVLDLDWQIKQLKAQGRNTKNLERHRKKGRFVVTVFHPMAVHTVESKLGVEAVVLCDLRKAVEVVAEWGDPEGNLQDIADDNGYVKYVEVMDAEVRCAWVEGEEDISKKGTYQANQMHQAVKVTLLEPTEHGLGFINWVALFGSTGTEADSEEQYHPLLYGVMKTRSWETLNIASSLTFSDVIVHATVPPIIEEGPNPAMAEVDYTDAAKHMKMPPGNTAKPGPQITLDPGKTAVIDRIQGSIERSTISQILQGGQLPGNTAFASLNLATQTAVGALKPAKELTERTLAEIFTLMCMWTVATKTDLVGYVDQKGDEFYGQEMIIPWDTIPYEEDIYITVEITPDVPTDRQQRANTAALLTQFGYPRTMALEDVGVTDPESAMEKWMMERLYEHRMNLIMQQEQARVEADIQVMMAEVQMEIQEMMAGGQGQAGPAGGGQLPPEAMAQMQQDMQMQAMMGEAGVPGGQTQNPAAGGQPAMMNAPGQGQRTVDNFGNPIEGVEGALATGGGI